MVWRNCCVVVRGGFDRGRCLFNIWHTERVVSKVSVFIPTRNERFLQETIDDLFATATGDIEVIVHLDGYWPDPPLRDRPGLHIIHRARVGMRGGINACATLARGAYFMKCDAHCAFGEGWDEILQADCADNWVVIPRRYSLDPEAWQRRDKEPIDCLHYFWPYAHPDDLGLHGRTWRQRGRERKEIEIDEDVTFQGSCWFMSRAHWERIGPMSEVGYRTFMAEPQEIGLKTQLGPWEGQVVRNKRTWYAHLHKGRTYGRMYSMGRNERREGNAYSFDFWWRNRWTERTHDLEWLIERWPLMPGWPVDWRDRQKWK